MKILQVNITANWGSTGRIVEAIGDSIIEHGWVSLVAYGDIMNQSKSILLKVGHFFNRYMHYVEQFLFDREGLCSRIATKRFLTQLKKISPDIVHLHNIHDHWLNYKFLFNYLNQTDIQVVWTFHDCWPITGHCMHFVTQNCMRWKSGCYNCLMKGNYPKTIFDRSRKNWELKRLLFSGNKNLVVVACSNWIADFVKESFLGNKRIQIIHNGCDTNTFSPKPRTASTRFRIIAISNVWYPNKGEQDIYKLRQMLSESDYEIMMVGLSAEQMKNLPSGIIGIQRTQNIQDLVQLYSDADVLINPTYEDNFPTVNIESLACGTPVITYNTGGSPEAVDVNTGAVVEQGDIDALCEKIIEFHRSNFKLLHAADCRKRAVEKFNKERCFEKYIALYEDIMWNKPSVLTK